MIETTVRSVSVATPPTVAPETPVTEAAAHLRRPDVPALAVLDGGRVVGVLSGSDLVAMVAETDARPTVAAVMSAPATTTTAAATVAGAAATMRDHGVRHLPVVDDGQYRGILSAAALAPYLPRPALDIEWRGDPTRVDDGGRPGVTAGD